MIPCLSILARFTFALHTEDGLVGGGQPLPPHELPRLVRSVGRLRGGCFWLECWTTPIIPPDPKYREPMPEDLVSQRCAWPQACRAMATASIHSPIAWAAD